MALLGETFDRRRRIIEQASASVSDSELCEMPANSWRRMSLRVWKYPWGIPTGAFRTMVFRSNLAVRENFKLFTAQVKLQRAYGGCLGTDSR